MLPIQDTLDRARPRIQPCATDKLHGTLVKIEPIAQPPGVLDKTHNVRLGSMYSYNRDKVESLRASTSEIQCKTNSAIQIILSVGVRLYVILYCSRLMQTQTLTNKSNICFFKLNIATENRDRIDQIPITVEQAFIRQFDQYERPI